jgi:hypothetical protein
MRRRYQTILTNNPEKLPESLEDYWERLASTFDVEQAPSGRWEFFGPWQAEAVEFREELISLLEGWKMAGVHSRALCHSYESQNHAVTLVIDMLEDLRRDGKAYTHTNWNEVIGMVRYHFHHLEGEVNNSPVGVAIRLLARAMMTNHPIDRTRACTFIEERIGSTEIRKVLELD